jgi:hypothetical protein
LLAQGGRVARQADAQQFGAATQAFPMFVPEMRLTPDDAQCFEEAIAVKEAAVED